MTTPMPKHRWSKYSLPRLLMVVMLVVIPCSWFAVKMRQVKREREAVAALEKLGRRVDWSEPSGPASLRWLGDDFFMHVKSVDLRGPDVTDADMEHLKGLNQLESLHLAHTKVTDAGLENLKGPNRLQCLDLEKTKTTDAGLKRLQQALPTCGFYH